METLDGENVRKMETAWRYFTEKCLKWKLHGYT